MKRAVVVVACCLALLSGLRPALADSASDRDMANRYEQSAQAGDDDAQFYLGALHSAGVGRPRSDQEAFRWFSRATDQGHAHAMLIVAGLYAIGRGTTKDNVKAYSWAYIVASASKVDEYRYGARQLKSLLKKKMTSDEIGRAVVAAKAWRAVRVAGADKASYIEREVELDQATPTAPPLAPAAAPETATPAAPSPAPAEQAAAAAAAPVPAAPAPATTSRSEPSTATAAVAPADTAAPAAATPAPPARQSAAPAVPPAPAPVAAPAPPPQQKQAAAPAASTLPSANSPLGVWLTEEKEGKVRIEQCGPNLCGYSVQNGEQVLINMKPGKDKWSGRIFDPNSGSTYDSTIALKGTDNLRVQGCAFGRMFCGGQTWTRVN